MVETLKQKLEVNGFYVLSESDKDWALPMRNIINDGDRITLSGNLVLILNPNNVKCVFIVGRNQNNQMCLLSVNKLIKSGVHKLATEINSSISYKDLVNRLSGTTIYCNIVGERKVNEHCIMPIWQMDFC